MRKVRDYDAELKALGDKARALKTRKVQQLGELVASTGADNFDAETLAGILLTARQTTDDATKEAWRASGATFFQRSGRRAKVEPRFDGEAGGEAAPGDPPR